MRAWREEHLQQLSEYKALTDPLSYDRLRSVSRGFLFVWVGARSSLCSSLRIAVEAVLAAACTMCAAWECIAPFGRPVVPLVYMKV